MHAVERKIAAGRLEFFECKSRGRAAGAVEADDVCAPLLRKKDEAVTAYPRIVGLDDAKNGTRRNRRVDGISTRTQDGNCRLRRQGLRRCTHAVDAVNGGTAGQV